MEEQINQYLSGLPEQKRSDLRVLHESIQQYLDKLWFFDGRDEIGEVVSNPQIGYGSLIQRSD